MTLVVRILPTMYERTVWLRALVIACDVQDDESSLSDSGSGSTLPRCQWCIACHAALAALRGALSVSDSGGIDEGGDAATDDDDDDDDGDVGGDGVNKKMDAEQRGASAHDDNGKPKAVDDGTHSADALAPHDEWLVDVGRAPSMLRSASANNVAAMSTMETSATTATTSVMTETAVSSDTSVTAISAITDATITTSTTTTTATQSNTSASSSTTTTKKQAPRARLSHVALLDPLPKALNDLQVRMIACVCVCVVVVVVVGVCACACTEPDAHTTLHTC
jgi:hypothetical protein